MALTALPLDERVALALLVLALGLLLGRLHALVHLAALPREVERAQAHHHARAGEQRVEAQAVQVVGDVKGVSRHDLADVASDRREHADGDAAQ